MHGMHSIFPADKDGNKDLTSVKKLIKKDGQWNAEKELLEWTFEGVKKSMVLEESKTSAILTTLQGWLQSKRGIPFAKFHKSVSRVMHTTKGIPVAHAMFLECNQSIDPKPPIVFIWGNSKLHHCIQHFRASLKMAHM